MASKKQVSIGIISTILGSTIVLTGCGSSSTTTTSTQKETASNVNSVKDGIFQATDMSKIPAASKNRPDTFVAGISKPGGVFLPHFYHNGWDGNVTDVMFASLISHDKNGKPIPQLASNWDISPDQLKYTFHLRPNLKFSDGSPLTAEDVAFTLTILHDKSYDGEDDVTLAHIAGGQDYKNGTTTSIKGIKVIDPQTIEIDTDQVSAQALSILGGPVLSKAYYGKDYKQGHLDYLKNLYSKPMGAGPYKFDSYIPGQEVRFTANSYYYAGKPSIEHFIYKVTTSDTNFQLLQTGETDYDGFTANADNFTQLQSLGFANVNLYTSSAYGYIELNNKKPYLKDTKVRQALMYGLDREKIVDSFYQGYGSVANEPISPVSWAYTNDVNKYTYNLDSAKKLLDEDGWKVGSDGIRAKNGQKLTLDFLGANTTPINNSIIAVAKENFKALGIGFNAELLDFNSAVDKVTKGDFDMASFSTSMLVDPDDAVEEFVSNSPANSSGYSNPKVDQLVKEGVGTLDINKRKQIYHDLYQELSNDPPYLFLYYRKILNADNGRIKGLEPDNFTGIIGTLPTLKIGQ